MSGLKDTGGTRRANILIVDDRESNLDLLEALLGGFDVAITRAISGEEALALMEKWHFALVLLDVMMPGMDGFELAERMRGGNNENMHFVPIIFITAESARNLNIFRGYETGAVDFLTKPIVPLVLLSKVKIFVELWQQRQKMILSQKMEAMGTLAGGIAHEINTPIQYIGDNLNFIGESTRALLSLIDAQAAAIKAATQGEPLERSLADIEKIYDDHDIDFLRQEMHQATEQSIGGIDQVSGIVLAMKEYSYPTSKEKTSVDLNRVVERTSMVSRNEWKDVAEMSFDLAENMAGVYASEGELNQAVLNLIVNAGHAIADKPGREGFGRIHITTKSDGDDALIHVQDDGAGIPKDVCDHVFNPFFTTKDVGKGTGQGLSITHDIVVNRHDGTIGFETEEGRGTRFTIRLPFGDGR